MFVVVGASALHTGLDLSQQLSLEGATLPGIFTGLAAGAAFLFGFESSAALAQETKDPKRNIPWAIMSAPLLLGLLYLVTTVLSVPGLMQASDAIAAGVSAPAALAANAGLPSWLAVLTDTVLTIATLAGVIGFLNYGSRFVATLADDQLLPATVGRIHSTHRTPSNAVLLLSGAALIFLALLVTVFAVPIVTLLTALGILIVACWIFPYIVVCAGAMRLLVRERALTVVLGFATVIGAATVAWVFLNNILNPPPAPLNLIPYGFLVGLVIVMVLFVVVKRNRSRQSTIAEEMSKE
jgi:amino acid transporter